MRTPVPALDVQETENPNAINVSAPDVIHGYNTNTAPHMDNIGVDFSGLQRGVGSAVHAGEEYESAQAKLWAMNQASKYNIAMHQELGQAEANGTPVNTAEFDARWEKNAEEAAKGGFDGLAQNMFLEYTFGLRARAVNRGINIEAQYNLKKNRRDFTDALTGALVSQGGDPVANMHEQIKTVKAMQNVPGMTSLVPDAPRIVSQAISAAVQGGLAGLAKQIGPIPAATVISKGGLGVQLDPVQEQHTVNLLWNQGEVDSRVGVSVARQKLDAFKDDESNGTSHSPKEWGAAFANLARAQAHMEDPGVGPRPDLVQGLLKIQDYRKQELSEMADSGKASNSALEAIDQYYQTGIVSTAMAGIRNLPFEQQVQKVNEIKAEFNDRDSVHLWASMDKQLGDAKRMLAPTGSKTADPAGYANKNPDINDALTKWMSAPSSNPQERGDKYGLLTLYKEKSSAAQNAVGVPVGSEMLLPKDVADNIRAGLRTDQAKGDFIREAMGNPDKATGNQLIGEVMGNGHGQVSGAVNLLRLNPDNKDFYDRLANSENKVKYAPKDIHTMGALVQKNPLYSAIVTQDTIGKVPGGMTPTEWEETLSNAALDLQHSHNGLSNRDAVNTVVQESFGHAYVPVTQGGKMTLFPTGVFKDEAEIKQHIGDADNLLHDMVKSRDNNTFMGGTTPADYTPLGELKSGWLWGFNTPHVWAYDDRTKSLTFLKDLGGHMAPVKLQDGRTLQFNLAALKSVLEAQKRSISTPGEFWSSSHLDELIPKNAIPPQYQSPPIAPQATSQVVPSGKPVSIPMKVTQYGYPGDSTPDSNTKKGIGLSESMHLQDGVSAALSPSSEKKLNAKPNDVLKIEHSDGKVSYVRFHDRTSQKLKDDRVDLYKPGGFDKGIPVSGTVTNLGPKGGS